MRKTKLMLSVEQAQGESLEEMLPHMINAEGLSATANQLGVSKPTLGYWLLKLGINVKRVALAPGEQVFIQKPK